MNPVSLTVPRRHGSKVCGTACPPPNIARYPAGFHRRSVRPVAGFGSNERPPQKHRASCQQWLCAGDVPLLCRQLKVHELGDAAAHQLHGHLRRGDVWAGRCSGLRARLWLHQAAGRAAANSPEHEDQGLVPGSVLLANCQLSGALGKVAVCSWRRPGENFVDAFQRSNGRGALPRRRPWSPMKLVKVRSESVVF